MREELLDDETRRSDAKVLAAVHNGRRFHDLGLRRGSARSGSCGHDGSVGVGHRGRGSSGVHNGLVLHRGGGNGGAHFET